MAQDGKISDEVFCPELLAPSHTFSHLLPRVPQDGKISDEVFCPELLTPEGLERLVTRGVQGHTMVHSHTVHLALGALLVECTVVAQVAR